jgi:hypothetical protein
LLELLEDGLRQIGDASFGRVAEALRAAASQVEQRIAAAQRQAPTLQLRPEGIAQLLGERLALLQQQVYTRHFAYARGLMNGGRIDAFFDRLPRLQLAPQPVYEALFEGAVDIEEELLAPLTSWYDGYSDVLRSQLRAARQEVILQRLELDQRLIAPLFALQRAVGATNPAVVQMPSASP